ncbi:50S ribosomal protein L11 [Candidatus Kaiserbacteria bacterium RIFCSPLOWO2_02_FULL_55_12]|uniref:Large ribosomal subunit protein uL11 n=2 Tax=Candidatus Kaiseribacteriota TaxID=1752734 RepID=A0A1F6EYY2_9BACT|nr:MAG: 50S ribosomal protein L11 [Candidatus Kaiserbacteria bacterium RIFCSPHIGHO2_02_FULL_55_17]OGG78831.1 MAG: 50S ribosomal protein L11 [Candidatus Kaiserbacteria bacterium RIFCSPLOWO2_02_FULL_55_12]
MATITKKIKLQIPGGAATPAPPVGTALGPAGVNIGQFVTQFNEATKDKRGTIIPIELSVYDDRSFTFIMKNPPASRLILKALGIEKGSGKAKETKAGTLTKAQVAAIVEEKMPDMNASTPLAAARTIAGTARSMGVEVK